MAEACQNCKAHGAEWVKRRGAGDKPRYWSSCRAAAPTMSTEWVGLGPLGEAWMGVHPWVPYGHWCLAYVAGEDSTAVHIEFGKLKLRDKHPKE